MGLSPLKGRVRGAGRGRGGHMLFSVSLFGGTVEFICSYIFSSYVSLRFDPGSSDVIDDGR